MSPRELRKLKDSLKETWKSLMHQRAKLRKEMLRTEKSMEKVSRLEDSAQYYLGKQRALECPVFKNTGRAHGRCMVHQPDWSSSFIHLFRNRCSKCKLHRKTRLKIGTLNGVFGRKVTRR